MMQHSQSRSNPTDDTNPTSLCWQAAEISLCSLSSEVCMDPQQIQLLCAHFAQADTAARVPLTCSMGTHQFSPSQWGQPWQLPQQNLADLGRTGRVQLPKRRHSARHRPSPIRTGTPRLDMRAALQPRAALLQDAEQEGSE